MLKSSSLLRIRDKALGTWDKLRSNAPAWYSPLDIEGGEIRLVALMNGNSGDEIKCQLSTAFLGHKPSYEALSWAWGDTNSTRKIYVNGRRYLVTDNLYSALLHLRSCTAPRVLWIDAICINQIDVQERNLQVQHMGAIFQGASEVIAWLGKADENSDLAFDTFETFYVNDQLHWDLENEDSLNLELGVEHAIAVENLFKRSWWHRVWTVQESVLPRKLVFICGRRKIAAEKLFETCQSYNKHSFSCCFTANRKRLELPMNIIDRIRTNRDDVYDGRNRLNFAEIIARYRLRRSTDPRDKIYGLLGLAADEDSSFVVPDYSTPVPVVYENFTLSFLQSSRNLDIFSQICPQALEMQGPRTVDLPSWVPDFASNLDYNQTYTLKQRLTRMVHLNATRGSRAFVQHLGPGRIALRGLILDTITTLSKPYDSINDCSYLHWQDMVGNNEQSGLSYPPMANTTYYEAYRQTISASFLPKLGKLGISNQYIRTADNSTHLKWYEAWYDWYEIHDRRAEEAGSTSPEFTDGSLGAYTGYVTDATFMRRLFLAETTGFLGLAPMSADIGDKIALLEGGKVPYILRQRVDSETDYYEMVGDAYMYGVMDGEAWKPDLLREITLV